MDCSALRISSPCPVSWDTMRGDDRIRYCGQCRLNVYNLAIMSPREVEAIVRRSGGRLCGRLFVRDDGTATLRNCAGARLRRKALRMWVVATVLLLACFAWILRLSADSHRSVHPRWIQKVVSWIDPDCGERPVAGRLAPPR
ncbi:MAG: hypothetical protein HY293_19025 [Planctomycetes bacterium]|nr:hypothetical protein [Planctomycetota bacterium]